MSAHDELERQLRGALRAREPQTSTAPRRRRLGRASALAASVLAATSLTVAIAADDPPSPKSQVEQAFALFRAPAEPGDEIPNARYPDATSRQLPVDVPGRMYAQVRDSGTMCLIYLGPNYGTRGCADVASATDVATPIAAYPAAPDGRVLAIGLMPDGVQEVRLHTRSGTKTVEVRENAFAVAGRDPVSLSWTDAEGRTYTQPELEIINKRP